MLKHRAIKSLGAKEVIIVQENWWKCINYYDFFSVLQYITNKMQIYTVCLYLETTLHVSGVTSTHRQERLQLYLQHLVFVTL